MAFSLLFLRMLKNNVLNASSIWLPQMSTAAGEDRKYKKVAAKAKAALEALARKPQLSVAQHYFRRAALLGGEVCANTTKAHLWDYGVLLEWIVLNLVVLPTFLELKFVYSAQSKGVAEEKKSAIHWCSCIGGLMSTNFEFWNLVVLAISMVGFFVGSCRLLLLLLGPSPSLEWLRHRLGWVQFLAYLQTWGPRGVAKFLQILRGLQCVRVGMVAWRILLITGFYSSLMCYAIKSEQAVCGAFLSWSLTYTQSLLLITFSVSVCLVVTGWLLWVLVQDLRQGQLLEFKWRKELSIVSALFGIVVCGSVGWSAITAVSQYGLAVGYQLSFVGLLTVDFQPDWSRVEEFELGVRAAMGRIWPGAEIAPMVLTLAEMKLAGAKCVGSAFCDALANANLALWLEQTRLAVAPILESTYQITQVPTLSLGEVLAVYKVSGAGYLPALAFALSVTAKSVGVGSGVVLVAASSWGVWQSWALGGWALGLGYAIVKALRWYMGVNLRQGGGKCGPLIEPRCSPLSEKSILNFKGLPASDPLMCGVSSERFRRPWLPPLEGSSWFNLSIAPPTSPISGVGLDDVRVPAVVPISPEILPTEGNNLSLAIGNGLSTERMIVINTPPGVPNPLGHWGPLNIRTALLRRITQKNWPRTLVVGDTRLVLSDSVTAERALYVHSREIFGRSLAKVRELRASGVTGGELYRNRQINTITYHEEFKFMQEHLKEALKANPHPVYKTLYGAPLPSGVDIEAALLAACGLV